MRTLRLASLLACCACVANLSAQDEGRRVRRGTDQAPGATGQTITTTETTTREEQSGRRGGRMMAGGTMDRDFAIMLTFGNQGEVDMANFVKDKLQNDQAKQFAQHMIQDHSAFLQQLNQFAGKGAPGVGEPPAGNAAVGVNTPAGGIQVRTNPPAGTGVDVAVGGGQGVNVGVGAPGTAGRSFYAPGMNPMLSIKKEICDECLALAKKELEQKQGVEVDKCYIGTQIVKHTEMMAQLTVLQRRAQDSQFKEMLGTAMQKTQQHLDMAKNIMKQLDQQKSS